MKFRTFEPSIEFIQNPQTETDETTNAVGKWIRIQSPRFENHSYGAYFNSGDNFGLEDYAARHFLKAHPNYRKYKIIAHPIYKGLL